MTLANANSLFQGIFIPPNFNKKIHIKHNDDEDRLLKDARRKIRGALRGAFKEFAKFAANEQNRAELIGHRTGDIAKASRRIGELKVRFLTQGSHAYRTLVRPALKNQEIDLDDGVYIPMPFINGRPVLASKGLFLLIENALADLVKHEGWKFEQKDTCVRITLTGKNAHIDLPLYAVDRHAFRGLHNQFQATFGARYSETNELASLLHTDKVGRSIRIQEDDILLADRSCDWRRSDPQALHDWFEANVDLYGPVLRRLSRYGKAWRDLKLSKSELSSLAIMVIAVETLEALDDNPSDNRDDQMVLAFAHKLCERVREGHIVWREGEPPLDEDWDDNDCLEILNAAETLVSEMEAALNGTYNGCVVVEHLRKVFGRRFPDNPDAVKVGASNQTAIVTSTPATSRPSPDVGTSVVG